MPSTYIGITKPSLAADSWIDLRHAWRALSNKLISKRSTLENKSIIYVGENTEGFFNSQLQDELSMPQALIEALKLGRWEHAILSPLTDVQERLQPIVMDLEREIGSVRLFMYLYFSRDGATGIISIVDLDRDIGENPRADPIPMRAWLEPQLEYHAVTIASRATEILKKIFEVHDNSWTILGSYTHLIALATGGVQSVQSLKQSHRMEELDDTDVSKQLALDKIGIRYARPGWSNSSFEGSKLMDLVLVVPQIVHIDLIYGMLWERTRILLDDVPVDDNIKLAAATKRLAFLETLLFELKVWQAEQERYVRGLKPWQNKIYEQLSNYWNIASMEERTIDLLNCLRENAASRINVLSAKDDRIQSLILGSLTVFGLIGIFSSASGYFYFLEQDKDVQLSAVTQSIFFRMLIEWSPFFIVIIIVMLMYRLWRR